MSSKTTKQISNPFNDSSEIESHFNHHKNNSRVFLNRA